jgi:hypothetical protein
MSYGQPQLIPGLKAGADLTDKRGYAVKISASEDFSVVVVSAITDACVGVLHSGNTIGKNVEVGGSAGGSKVIAGAAFASGAELTFNAAGKFITATAGTKVMAIAKEAATAIDQLIDVTMITYIKA